MLCRSSRSRTLFELAPYAYRRCSDCGLVRLSPRIARSSIADYYETYGHEMYDGNRVPISEQLTNPTFKFRASRIELHRSGGRFFEVGCGDGNFLAVMRSRGWTVEGSELSVSAARVASERHRLKVHRNPSGVFQLPGRWDVVGIYHVIEHLYEPRQVLSGIRQSLPSGGLLHLQVPNYRSLDARFARSNWWYLGCPEHVHLFEPRNITRLLDEHGFSSISVKTYDPWHSPHTVALTVEMMLRSRWNRRTVDSTTVDKQAAGRGLVPHEAIASSFTKRAIARSIREFGWWGAVAQASIGWGNVIDIVARAR